MEDGKTDLAVVILTGNEELHIRRCLERLAPLGPRQVFVVESQTGDRTHAIAREMGAETVFHAWPGTQSVQFNWALDNLPIVTAWILRLDADEYLDPDAVAELRSLLGGAPGALPEDVTSLALPLARVFCGRRLRFAREIVLVRAFRKGFGRCSQAEMDERIVTSSGTCRRLRGRFVDDSLLPMDAWRAKHRAYAKREARMAALGCANANKRLYYRLPRYFRAVAYFCVRYFIRGGFLDGYAGWMWNFWQGLWYRWTVDRELGFLI